MRGVAMSKDVPANNKCVRCKARWRQHDDGLCRTCHRAGVVTNPVALAMETLRHFIDRQRLHLLHATEPFAKEGQRQTLAAQNALDVIGERLRATEALLRSTSVKRADASE